MFPDPPAGHTGADGYDDAGGNARRRELVARLRRVNDALVRWNEWEAVAQDARDGEPASRRPTLSRDTLARLALLLVEELAELEPCSSGDVQIERPSPPKQPERRP